MSKDITKRSNSQYEGEENLLDFESDITDRQGLFMSYLKSEDFCLAFSVVLRKCISLYCEICDTFMQS